MFMALFRTFHALYATHLGFCTGMVQVWPDDTVPTPFDTAPLQDWGTHHTHISKVLWLTHGST